jgi:hypothetical protein
MFEPEESEKTAARRRSRAILMIGLVGAIVLTILALLVRESLRAPNAPAGLENASRAGTPDFESYREMVTFDDKEIIVHPNLIGMAQYEVRAKMTNRGDRKISGIELGGKMYDLRDQVIAQSVSMPIPRLRKEPLPPGESMRVSVKVDAPSKVTEADVKDVKLELLGLRFE